jgi:hypothetical protein
METNHWYEVNFLVPSPKTLKGRLVEVIPTMEGGSIYHFIGRKEFYVKSDRLVSASETSAPATGVRA